MHERDFIDEQKEIANARIEVIEGAFIGVIVGLVISVVAIIFIIP